MPRTGCGIIAHLHPECLSYPCDTASDISHADDTDPLSFQFRPAHARVCEHFHRRISSGLDTPGKEVGTSDLVLTLEEPSNPWSTYVFVDNANQDESGLYRAGFVSTLYGLNGGEEKTQKEVADMMGISQSYISRLEKKIIVRLKKEFAKTAATMSVAPSLVFDTVGEEPQLPVEESKQEILSLPK